MPTRVAFTPTARQVNVLLAIGFVSIGYALYLRYMAIEQSTVGLACDGGLSTWLCATRGFATLLFNNGVFGWVALAAAVLNLLRPSLFLLNLGLAAGCFGVVLYNGGLAALALALLILALGRPRPAAD